MHCHRLRIVFHNLTLCIMDDEIKATIIKQLSKDQVRNPNSVPGMVVELALPHPEYHDRLIHYLLQDMKQRGVLRTSHDIGFENARVIAEACMPMTTDEYAAGL